MLVVRDDKGDLRAYLNVCRHRGSRLLSGSGQCKAAIRCRYHGWTYKMDGSLIGVPEGMAFGEKLDKPSLSLMPVRVEEMCGLVFVNLDNDAAPLAELVGDLPQRLAPYRLETLTPFAPAGGTQPANWKVVADNYIEGYHIPIAHPGLMRMLDYKHYDVEVNEHYLWFDAPMRDKPSSNRLERLYAQLVTPMPGLPRAGPHACGATSTSIPTRRSTSTPTRWAPGSSCPTAWPAPATCRPPTARRAPARAPGSCSGPTSGSTRSSSTRTSTSSTTSSRACRRAATAAGRCRRRENGVAWFADRIRADLAPAMRTADGTARLMASRRDGRERILAAAVGQIAREGIDGVRIARIAMEAGVSTANVHYHFETREALLAEALEYSYAQAGDVRVESDLPVSATHAERLQSMIDQCLPTTPALEEDWVLWVELWLRAVRHPELRPVAEELYARMRAWFADEITAGIRDGEFERCDPEEVADRTLALLDGFGVRTLIGDSTIPLERARRVGVRGAGGGAGARRAPGQRRRARQRAVTRRGEGRDGAADLRSTA